MSKYCYNCGAEVKKDKPFCGDCGTMLNIDAPDIAAKQAVTDEQSDTHKEQPQAKKRNKKALFIVLAASAAVVIGLAAVTAVLVNTEDNYTAPVESMLAGLQTNDYIKWKSAFFEDYPESSFQKEYGSLVKDVGENLKLEHEITKAERLDKDTLEAVSDTFGVILKEGYELDVRTVVRGQKGRETITDNMYVVMRDGKWYICLLKGRTISDKFHENDTYESPLIAMLNGLNSKEFSTFISSFTPSFQILLKERMAADGLNDDGYMHALALEMGKVYGKGFKLSYTVSDAAQLSASKLTSLNSSYNLGAVPQDGYKLTFNLKVENTSYNKINTYTVMCVSLKGVWYITDFPEFISKLRILSYIDSGKYAQTFQIAINGLIEQNYYKFAMAFVPNYFNYTVGNLDYESKMELVKQYFNVNNFSPDVKLRYDITDIEVISFGQLEEFRNKFSLASVPSEGNTLFVKWTVNDGTSRSYYNGYVKIIRIDSQWYFVEMKPIA